MNVLVSGSSGLVGSALVSLLTSQGHAVSRLVRGSSQAREQTIFWDPENRQVETAAQEGFDAVVHLAGENIASGRWTEERKARIRNSRVLGTQCLAEALARLNRPPRIFASASAIGYYGSRGEELLDENSSSGSGFLAEVCRSWEAATAPAVDKGIRVALTRFGVVLSPQGGALAKMLFPFRMGVGGRVGNGRQYMSWIALDDAVGAIHHALITDVIQGPVNVVAPYPVSNLEFTKALGRAVGRPTIFPMPTPVVRLVFGKMADETLLASTRVEPARLKASGFAFRFPEVEGALRHMLGRPKPG
jgi:uncharacterized protein (TIGR01777 family)